VVGILYVCVLADGGVRVALLFARWYVVAERGYDVCYSTPKVLSLEVHLLVYSVSTLYDTRAQYLYSR
jgi:hypothetical protein